MKYYYYSFVTDSFVSTIVKQNWLEMINFQKDLNWHPLSYGNLSWQLRLQKFNQQASSKLAM